MVDSRYGRSPLEYGRNAVLAVSSIYGIDILEDNVIACRNRLLDLFDKSYGSLYSREECLATVRFLLERNIIWGDARTLMTVGPDPRPIVFSEWSPVNGNMIKRRDFAFRELVSFGGMIQEPLFSDLGERAFVPEPLKKEYPLTHYLRLTDGDKQ